MAAHAAGHHLGSRPGRLDDPAGRRGGGSQGVIGRLADRRWLYQVAGGTGGFPLHTADTYFVLVPYAGIETASVELQLAMIGRLAGPLHATLLSSADGVWVFRLPRGGGPDAVTFAPTPTEPAWAVQTSTGRRLLDGPSYTWNMAVDGSRPGYVTFGANWNLLPGTYRTTVTMDTSVPTEVETWDSTKNVLFAVDRRACDQRPGGRPVGGAGHRPGRRSFPSPDGGRSTSSRAGPPGRPTGSRSGCGRRAPGR